MYNAQGRRWGGGGEWCGRPERQSQMGEKTNILNKEKSDFKRSTDF
jgi:hypothetical protein